MDENSCSICRGKVYKIKEKPKAKDKEDSELDVKSEHFNFQNIDIGTESDSELDHGRGGWLTTEICAQKELWINNIFII